MWTCLTFNTLYCWSGGAFHGVDPLIQIFMRDVLDSRVLPTLWQQFHERSLSSEACIEQIFFPMRHSQSWLFLKHILNPALFTSSFTILPLCGGGVLQHILAPPVL